MTQSGIMLAGAMRASAERTEALLDQEVEKKLLAVTSATERYEIIMKRDLIKIMLEAQKAGPERLVSWAMCMLQVIAMHWVTLGIPRDTSVEMFKSMLDLLSKEKAGEAAPLS